MKLFFLLAVLPVLCRPASGTPLRAQDLLFSVPLAPSVRSELDENLIPSSKDALAVQQGLFPALFTAQANLVTLLPDHPTDGITTELDTTPDFVARPEADLPLPRVPLAIRPLLAYADAFHERDDSQLLFLIVGLTLSGTLLLRRVPAAIEKRLNATFRATDRPRQRRIRIQQRKMAC